MSQDEGKAQSQQSLSSNDSNKKEALEIPVESMTKGKIHPVVIFPFTWRSENPDLKLLYTDLVAKLASDNDNYAKPITVMDYKTYYTNAQYKFDEAWNKEFLKFINDTVMQHSKLIRA